MRSPCFVCDRTTAVDRCLMSRLFAGACLRPRQSHLELLCLWVGFLAANTLLPSACPCSPPPALSMEPPLPYPCRPPALSHSNGKIQKDSMQVIDIDLTWSHCGGEKVPWLQTSSCREPGCSAPTPAPQSSASRASGSGCSSEQSQSPQA